VVPAKLQGQSDRSAHPRQRLRQYAFVAAGQIFLDRSETLGFADWQWVFLASGPSCHHEFSYSPLVAEQAQASELSVGAGKELVERRGPEETERVARTRNLLVCDP
jgi:hypothetical protein